MASVNKAILIGNLGKDPEFKRTPGGSSVATFTLATNERWLDKNGQKQEKTTWHNIVAWGKLADLASQYLKKGRSCYVEGRIDNRSYDDKDGNKKYISEIKADQIQFLDGGASGGGSRQSAPTADFSDSQAPSMPESAPQSVAEDDLPF